MSKKRFVLPYIALNGGLDNGGDDSVIGQHTGQGGTDAVAVSFTAWMANTSWCKDYDQSGGDPDEWDYAYWWEMNHFTREQWEDVNGNTLPWDDYFDNNP